MNIKIKCHFPAGTLRFAAANVQDESGNWESRILSMSPLLRAIGQDKTYEVSGIDIEFSDHDRVFRDMLNGPNRAIACEKVEILTENNEIIYVGNVQKWGWGEGIFKLSINDQLTGLTKFIPSDNISRKKYSAVPDGGVGASISIIYGVHESEYGAIKAWKVEPAQYLIACHHCYSIEKVFDPDKNEVTSGWEMLNEIDGRCYLKFDTTQQHDYYCLNVKGKKKNTGILNRHPLQAMINFLGAYTDLEHDISNAPELQKCFNERGYLYMDYAITKPMKVHEVLSDFCRSFDCDFLMTNAGKITVKIMDYNDIQVEKEFKISQIIDITLDEDPETILNKVKYMYAYNYAGDYFQHLPIHENVGSISTWGVHYDTLPLRMVSDDSIAFDVVQRHCIQKKNPKRKAEACFPLVEFAGLDCGSIIRVENPIHVSEQPRIYKIESYNVQFENDTVDVSMVDINQLSGAFFILGDETLPGKWPDADDYQRKYAYLADTTGFFSTGEPGKVLS
jgi:hypothetical protein